MKTVVCLLLLCLSSAFGHDGDASCHDVTSKLVAFFQSVMGPPAPAISGVIQSATGLQILSVTNLEQYTCPFLASQSIVDVGNALRSSGLLRIITDTACAVQGVLYSKMKAEFIDSGMAAQYMTNQPPQIRELMQAGLTALEHLEDMGFFNLNPEGFHRIQGLLSMVQGMQSAPSSPLQAHPGNPGAYTQAQREAIMTQDVLLILTKARNALGGRWSMVTMVVNMYSGGLVDLNDRANVDSLVSAIAASNSMDGKYNFVSNTLLMPLLNFYYPQLDTAFMMGERNYQSQVAHIDEYVEQGYMDQVSADSLSLQAANFAALHAAVRATGVLDLHW